ncbi:MAG: 4Fe-4S binding protein [Candidatus Omnitrophica bacterium]|nr:4Fe-4S binding protein [Candidatus Omnitrophota bacterium]
MARRKIISIDENKCNGCGQCVPNCPEGALQVIDKKARLVSDLFCDGLGACIGHCPQGAITVEEREAGPYDEKKVMENIVRHGKNTIKAHLIHLEEHNEQKYLKLAIDFLKAKDIPNPLDSDSAHETGKPCGCQGSKMVDFRKEKVEAKKIASGGLPSQLGQWPVQIRLVSALAPYFENVDLLIAADCVPFAYADFHEQLLKGKILLVGCPKLDDLELYREKINQIIANNSIRSVTYAHMEVPCCFGLIDVVKNAILASGKEIPFNEVNISIKGERIK